MEYTSAEAKNEWAEKIERASILGRLEYETVKHGLRLCGLLFGIDPERLDELTSQYAKDGIVLKPIAKMAMVGKGFAHVMRPPKENDAYQLKCVIARSRQDADQFSAAEHDRNEAAIGPMLGYPDCCTRFFERVWKQGCFDPIWQIAENTAREAARSKDICYQREDSLAEQTIVLPPNAEGCKISSFFRYIGVRITSHFACSMNCRASIEISDQRIDLARQLGIVGIDAALEVLRLPCRWECQHGVAVITAPVFQFRMPSMSYAVKHVVQQE